MRSPVGDTRTWACARSEKATPVIIASYFVEADATTAVVTMYCARMQIEETFRDIKSHRYGWSLEDVRCRTPARVDVLLLIAALATIAVHIIGIAAQFAQLHRQQQANTERKRLVFSLYSVIVARKNELVVRSPISGYS